MCTVFLHSAWFLDGKNTNLLGVITYCKTGIQLSTDQFSTTVANDLAFHMVAMYTLIDRL